MTEIKPWEAAVGAPVLCRDFSAGGCTSLRMQPVEREVPDLGRTCVVISCVIFSIQLPGFPDAATGCLFLSFELIFFCIWAFPVEPEV